MDKIFGKRISREYRSLIMSKIHSKNTSLEVKVRKYLSSKGYRYRLNYSIKGKPDIVFVSRRIAIFIDGCFWHLHYCVKEKLPKNNSEFWREKLMNNKKRDIRNRQYLRKHGWKIITIAECRLRNNFGKECEKLDGLLSN